MRHSKQEKPRTQEVIKRWKIGLAALVFYQISAFALTILAVRFKLDWLVSIESLPGGGQALEFTPLTILIPLALTLIVYAAATHYFRGRLSAIQ